eukprot:366478-Chlamydomonas_euryale.AAC.10
MENIQRLPTTRRVLLLSANISKGESGTSAPHLTNIIGGIANSPGIKCGSSKCSPASLGRPEPDAARALEIEGLTTSWGPGPDGPCTRGACLHTFQPLTGQPSSVTALSA